MTLLTSLSCIFIITLRTLTTRSRFSTISTNTSSTFIGIITISTRMRASFTFFFFYFIVSILTITIVSYIFSTRSTNTYLTNFITSRLTNCTFYRTTTFYTYSSNRVIHESFITITVFDISTSIRIWFTLFTSICIGLTNRTTCHTSFTIMIFIFKMTRFT